MVWRRVEEWLDRLGLRREVVEYLRSEGAPAYLVGGTVRDALLGRESYDLDFAVAGDATAWARRMADRFGGALVVLDAERDVARVVWRTGDRRLYADLAGLRAGDVESDLWLRDFTVNAMALPLQGGRHDGPAGGLLDPTGGRDDLAARRLRVTTQAAFRDDPLRLLRAVRLRGTLGFAMDADTERLMRRDRQGLTRVSAERVRDELFLILDLGDAAAQLAYAHGLGLLNVALPEVAPRAEDALATLGRFERLYGALIAGRDAGPPEVRGHTDEIRGHWQGSLSDGRALGSLAKLAALAAAAPDARALGRRLRLSGREVDRVARTVSAAWGLLAGAGEGLAVRLHAHRHYRAFGDAGVDGALLAPALPGAEGEPGLWATVAALLGAWFRERDAVVDPPRLLSGRDVLALLGGRGGPLVGRILEGVREAQAVGTVTTREGALALARRHARAATEAADPSRVAPKGGERRAD